MNRVEVQALSFDSEGDMEISFYLPESDVKAPGVARMQTLIVPRGYRYDDEMSAVYDAATHLILDILEDFEAMPSAITEVEPA